MTADLARPFRVLLCLTVAEGGPVLVSKGFSPSSSSGDRSRSDLRARLRACRKDLFRGRAALRSGFPSGRKSANHDATSCQRAPALLKSHPIEAGWERCIHLEDMGPRPQPPDFPHQEPTARGVNEIKFRRLGGRQFELHSNRNQRRGIGSKARE